MSLFRLFHLFAIVEYLKFGDNITKKTKGYFASEKGKFKSTKSPLS